VIDAVLDRLGLHSTASVEDIYREWCLTVPFDNLRKLRHLSTGDAGPLPGSSANDFFEAFLDEGVGGTCWPTSLALVTVLRVCGHDAWRVPATMRDNLIPRDSALRPNHGGVVARVAGEIFLVDPSMLTAEPLLLTSHPTENSDPLVGADATPLSESEWLVTFGPWRPDGRMQCRLSVLPIDDAACAARYEFSRSESPFNERLYVRRNFPDRLQILTGDEHWISTRAGERTLERVGDARSARQILVDDFAISESLVAFLDQ
jgi:N-hydroxyarylamine O-acetyltransferase